MQYPCDNFILSYFGNTPAMLASLNATGEAAFKRQLYLCMLGQALYLQSDIQQRRSDNQFGTVTWCVVLQLCCCPVYSLAVRDKTAQLAYFAKGTSSNFHPIAIIINFVCLQAAE